MYRLSFRVLHLSFPSRLADYAPAHCACARCSPPAERGASNKRRRAGRRTVGCCWFTCRASMPFSWCCCPVFSPRAAERWGTSPFCSPLSCPTHVRHCLPHCACADGRLLRPVLANVATFIAIRWIWGFSTSTLTCGGIRRSRCRGQGSLNYGSTSDPRPCVRPRIDCRMQMLPLKV